MKWGNLIDDSRANPNIPGNTLNELLFHRYGIYMKSASLCMTNEDVFDKIFGVMISHAVTNLHIRSFVKLIHNLSLSVFMLKLKACEDNCFCQPF